MIGKDLTLAIKLTTLTNVTITTAGTAVQVSSSAIMVNAVFVQAHENNRGNVYIGDSNVSATQGIAIGPGQPFQYSGHPQIQLLGEFLLSDVWVDSAEDADEVRVSYFKRKKYDAFTA